MSPAPAKKLGFLAAAAALATAAGIGALAHLSVDQALSSALRAGSREAAALLASRLGAELTRLAEKNQALVLAALREYPEPATQLRFLERNLPLDDVLIGVSVHERLAANPRRWRPVLRLSRPQGDAAHLSDRDFRDLELRYPVDFRRAAKGALEIGAGAIGERFQVFRLAVPLESGNASRILALELRQDRLTAAFAEGAGRSTALFDRDGRVLAQGYPARFAFDEDLSHLPLLRQARQNVAQESGGLDFSEIPGGPLQYGSFHRLGLGELVLVSQASRAELERELRDLDLRLAGAALFAALAAYALFWRIGGRLPAATVPAHGQPGLTLPKRRKKSRRALEASREAVVAQGRILGLEKLTEHPELLSPPLEKLNGRIAAAQASWRANVEPFLQGRIAAYWPKTDRAAGDAALSFGLELRAATRDFNDELERLGLPPVRLELCLHAGTLGTASQLAAKLAPIATQFATELLVTGPALALAPPWFSTDKLAPGDESTPELHELLGKAAQTREAA
ncbi:MAG: cache domain-containing protein [Oligoflexia bacterium]|nr:cache domain-containing protein [Oligoflexia bacterium]